MLPLDKVQSFSQTVTALLCCHCLALLLCHIYESSADNIQNVFCRQAWLLERYISDRCGFSLSLGWVCTEDITEAIYFRQLRNNDADQNCREGALQKFGSYKKTLNRFTSVNCVVWTMQCTLYDSGDFILVYLIHNMNVLKLHGNCYKLFNAFQV